jgi:BlaI family transcriptional regulator, penicillinase repressor
MDSLTDLQLAVMKALWELGEGSVGDVLEAMAKSGRELAPTTVATLLQRLSKQGWVKHRRDGRQFVYRAKINEKDAANGALGRVLRSFFGGRVSTLAAQLLASEEVMPEDLEAMRKLLEKKGG